MNDGSAKLISLGNLFQHGRSLLVPDKPCSPYRYIEFLIEGTMQRKYGLKRVAELGPGSDVALAYLDLDATEFAWAIDYSQGALDAVKRKLPGSKVQCRLADIMKPGVLDDLTSKCDYVICNSVIEHVIDHAALGQTMRALLAPGGYVVCTTVLHQSMYNLWDHAVGHYRRYSMAELVGLFADFSEVQVLQTSIAQELVRPLFFSRVRHLKDNTLEQNNLLTAVGHENWGRVPYAGIWPIMKYAMPAYLVAEWGLHHLVGGIGFVIGRK
jgi:SAM-dependent methyltransferase